MKAVRSPLAPRVRWLPALALLASSAAAREADFDYVLRVSKEPALHLDVHLECRGDPDGETTFSLSEDSGGVQEVGSWVDGLTIRGAQGKALEAKHPTSSRWTVKHAPGERLALDYSIAANERQLDHDPRVHYGPIVNANVIHLLGDLALLLPESALEEAPRHCALRWEGLEALGWSAVSVRGPGASVEMDVKPGHFRNAPFAAGRLRVHKRTIHGQPIFVSIAEGALEGDDDRFADLAARVIETQRTFFDDWNYPGFLISVVPVGAIGQRASSLGGTGLSDSFALYLAAGSRLDDPRSGMSLATLLSHEMFHHWNGQLFHIAESPQTSFWISEGFTDFFARRLELRSHLITDAEYVERLNRSLEQYYGSACVGASAVEIRERFFSDREYADQPYRRGDAIAMRIDHELRKRSAGTQCLDDLMRDLVLRGTRGETISPAKFYELLEARVGAEVTAHVRAVAEDGARLELPGDLFSPCLALEPAQIPRYDLGFDLDATMKEKVLRGVREGSRAHAAGLRDGMQLAALSLGDRSIDRPIQIDVLDGGKRRSIEWLPHGEPAPGYRLTRKDDTSCSRL